MQQLTTNSLPNENPKLALDPSGNIVLVWLQGDQLSSVVNFDFEHQQIIISNEYSSNLGDFTLAKGGGGQLAVVYAESSDNSSDLWAIFYDPIFHTWGSPRQMTDDPQTEMESSAAFCGQGQFLALYDRVDLDTSTNQSGSIITNADLYVLQYQVTADLALQTNSLIAFPANPVPGSNAILQVTLQNLGDQGAANIPVAFYLGDPANGGSLIGQTNITGPLAAGAFANVAFAWAVPLTTNPLAVYAVVDPNGVLQDANRLNNEESAIFVAPDLAVQSVTWTPLAGNLLLITTTVINLGTIPSLPAVLDVRPNTAAATNLFQTNIVSLPPGQSLAVNYVWDVSNQGANLTIFAVVDTGTNVDFNPLNNVRSLTVQTNLAQAVLKLGPVLFQAGGVPQILLTGLAGQTYSIQASTDLQNWRAITNLTLTNITGWFVDPSAPSVIRRFYRATASP